MIQTRRCCGRLVGNSIFRGIGSGRGLLIGSWISWGRNGEGFISGLISYRSGQYRRQLFTTYNVDRVEVAKGAAGIFFGTVRPGGVINYITRRPRG